MSKERLLPKLSRRSFLRNLGLLVTTVGMTSFLSGEHKEKEVNLIVGLNENTLGARLLTETQESENNSNNRQEEAKGENGSYLVWRLPLSSVEGCEEIRKYRTYKVFSENELGPHSCNVRAEIFYADWAEEGKGAWRVFITGGNPSHGEWCGVLIADCDSQNSAKAVLGKLTKGGCSEGAWCTNVNDCAQSGGEINIPSIRACKVIEDICCRKQDR